MRIKFCVENGSLEEAARITHERQPEMFATQSAASDFLMSSVAREFFELPMAKIAEHEWIWGPIMALPACVPNTARDGRAEYEVTIRFWHSLKNEDRSSDLVHEREG